MAKVLNSEVYKQMDINDFPLLLLFQPPTNIKSNVCHINKNNGQPICNKVYRISSEATKITKEEIAKLFDARIIPLQISLWGLPIHIYIYICKSLVKSTVYNILL